MVEIRGTFVYPDDLTPGRSHDGGISQLLYDKDGRLADHGTFIPDDDAGYQHDPEPDADGLTPEEAAHAVAVLLGLAVALANGAVRAAPHVRRWWVEKLLPRLRRRGSSGHRSAPAGTELIAIAPAAPVDFADVVDVALDDPGVAMGSDEACRRLAAVLAASAFIADQMRALSHVRIDDGAGLAELQRSMDRLTTERLADALNRTLESNTSLLDVEVSAELLRLLGGGGVVDGRYVPIEAAKVKEALRLPRVEQAGDTGARSR